MNQLYLNPTTWDLETSNGDFRTVSGRDAISQNIRQRLQTFVGEWFLDTTIHIDYFSKIFEKGITPAIVEGEFRRIIKNTSGVVEITRFQLTIDKLAREMSLSFTATSVDGSIEYNEIIKATR